MQNPDTEKHAGNEGQCDLHSKMGQLEQERKKPPQHGCERDEAAIDDEKPEHEVRSQCLKERKRRLTVYRSDAGKAWQVGCLKAKIFGSAGR